MIAKGVQFIIFIQAAFLGHFCFAADPIDSYVIEKLSQVDLLYIGELHTVGEHKTIIQSLLRRLVSEGIVQNFALEFTQSNNNTVLQKYLVDRSATPGSKIETEYFSKLHRSFFDMFNNSFYDEVMRLLRTLKLSHPNKFTVCAIDDSGLKPDTSDDGPNYQKLLTLPEKTRQMIQQISGLNIQQVAKSETDWTRETSMGVNIAKCGEGKGKGKTIAFVGLFHALNLQRAKLKMAWANAIQYSANLVGENKVAAIGLWQTYLDEPYELPNFKSKCQNLTKNIDLIALDYDKVPKQFEDCFAVTTGDKTSSYLPLFDGFIIGPPGTKISE